MTLTATARPKWLVCQMPRMASDGHEDELSGGGPHPPSSVPLLGSMMFWSRL